MSGLLGWLLARSVAGAAVAVVVAPIAALHRRPAARCTLWGIVLAALVLPDAATAPVAPLAPVGTLSAGVSAEPWGGWGWIWLAGASVVGIRSTVGLARAAALVHRATPDAVLQRLSEDWRRRLGIRRSVRVAISDGASSPFTMGLVRPVVVLPAAVAARSDLTEAVIAHEVAHIARLDAPAMILEACVGCAFWFHPAAAIAIGVRRRARELATDAAVLDAGFNPRRGYAAALIGVHRLALGPVTAPATSTHQRSLKMRIQAILDHTPRRPSLLPWGIAAVLLPLSGVAGPPAGMVHPLPTGRITLPFQAVADPVGDGPRQHKGIDLAAPQGTPVLAAADGVVTVASDAWPGSLASGTVVILDHGDGWTSRYTHLSALDVAPGDRVGAGETVGAVGSTGRSTGPHLHFEVRHRDVPQDPGELVSDL